MADENYAFFIEGITSTGGTTASYPIPGRVNAGDEKTNVGGSDAYEYSDKNNFSIPKKFQVYNTATVESINPYTQDEGTIIMQGSMGYMETEELYPTNPEIWGDLSGKNIRLHKFPDRSLVPLYGANGKTINILGVKFENIAPFTDFDGNIVPNIIGYRILRANREGHKTVVAKGLFNNMRGYSIPDSDIKGLYPNYPYNDLRKDIYLSSAQVTQNGSSSDTKALTEYKKDIFTFHSPETTFKTPSLSASEIKIDAEVNGTVTGSFDQVYKHPKHRLIEDYAVYTAGVVGTALGMIALNGRTTTYKTKDGDNAEEIKPKVQLGSTAGLSGLVSTASGALGLLSGIGGSGVISSIGTLLGNPIVSMGLNAITGGAFGVVKSLGGLIGLGGNKDKTTTKREQGTLDQATSLVSGNNAFLYTYFLSEGFDKALEVIQNGAPYRQFAYQYNSACFYNNWKSVDKGNIRRQVTASEYLEPYLQEFENYRVNNLFRGKSVMVQLNLELNNPTVTDNSRQTIGSMGIYNKPSAQISTTSSCYYGALKVKQPSQYGQPDSVNQIPISSEVHSFNGASKVATPVLFGGDIYINKFSEKNTMFFFNDWLNGQPDDSIFDYSLSPNLPYPRYWINTQPFNSSEVVQSFVKAASTMNSVSAAGSFIGGLVKNTNLGSAISAIGQVTGGISGTAVGLNAFNNANKPDNYYSLDQQGGKQKKSFAIKDGFFYLFNNGVREFFVESEMNLAHRDWEEAPEKRFYSSSSNTDLKTLFRSDIIKFTNFYKYDDSLSITKLLSNYISWNFVLPRDYNPTLEKSVYSYHDKRLIYSLPQNEEYKGDNWSKFLINNRKDFDSKITAIKAVGKSGAIIFFEDASPVFFNGVDQLQTTGGIKITIGDGGLFHQPLQATSNAERNYEYGSCQSKHSIISTPAGTFWISQNQGKIFQYGEGLKEISREGNKFWFAKYLPCQLTTQFPNYDYTDNTVIGVGCISGYDTTEEVLYFSKVDYSLKPEYTGAKYIGNNYFQIDNITKCKLGNPTYFDNASWTVSCDPSGNFISFHDWIPELMLSSRSHLLTTKTSGIWLHNASRDSYCKFYDTQYPFEVEVPVSTGQEVYTLRSVEYNLIVNKYYNNGRDKFHILDDNFDRGYIFNSEQCSGLLKFEMQEKNTPLLITDNIVSDNSGVVCKWAKGEQMIRFNQFYDLQRNRMEYSDYEPQPIWNISPNGYTKELNPLAINYQKNILQRKKFRHMTNYFLLRKVNPGDRKYILRFWNTKLLKSFN